MFTTTTDYQVSVFCLFVYPESRNAYHELRGVYASLEGAKTGATAIHQTGAHEHVWEQDDSTSWSCDVNEDGALCECEIEQRMVLP